MNVNVFNYLVKIAELGSFSKAAIVIGVNQPTLSRSIRDLEAELGVTVFYRDGRGVSLTDEGRKVLETAHAVSGSIEALRDDLEAQRTSGVTRAVVGLMPSTARILALPLMAKLRAESPDARIQFIEGSTSHLFEWLNDGRLDLAVINGGASANRFNPEVVITIRLHLIGPKSAGNLPAAVRFRDLAEYPLVLPSKAHATRREIENIARENAVRLNVVIDSDSMSALMKFVDAGYAWGIMPSFMKSEPPYDLQSAPIIDPPIERTIVLATPVNRPQTAGIQSLIKTFKSEIRRVYQNLEKT